MGGLKITIEWSKKSNNYDKTLASTRPHAKESRRDEKCYNCDRTGHYARECRSRRRSRSRSPRRGYRDRSDSRDRGRRDDYRRSPAKYRRRSNERNDRGRDDSPRRDYDRHHRSPPARKRSPERETRCKLILIDSPYSVDNDERRERGRSRSGDRDERNPSAERAKDQRKIVAADDKGDSFVSNGGGNEGTDVERKPTSD